MAAAHAGETRSLAGPALDLLHGQTRSIATQWHHRHRTRSTVPRGLRMVAQTHSEVARPFPTHPCREPASVPRKPTREDADFSFQSRRSVFAICELFVDINSHIGTIGT